MKVVVYTVIGIICIVVILLCASDYFTLRNSIYGKGKQSRPHARAGTFEGSFEIDAVVTYVDAGDPNWQKKKQQYLEATDSYRIDNPERWNDRRSDNAVEEIEICLLSILKNMPYIRTIHLVTQRPQQPACLLQNVLLQKAVNDNKIQLCFHDQFIPEEHLPTFSSNTIEYFLYMIPNLKEHFVYFNDDMFALSPVSREQLFTKDGLPIINGKIWFFPKLPVVCSPKNAFTCMLIRSRNSERSNLFTFGFIHQFRCFTKEWYANSIQYAIPLTHPDGKLVLSKFRSPDELWILKNIIYYGLENGYCVVANSGSRLTQKFIPCKHVKSKDQVLNFQAVCINNCNGESDDILQELKLYLQQHNNQLKFVHITKTGGI